MSFFSPLVTALCFLTRLAPAKSLNTDDLGRCMPWLPAAGLILGAVITLPLALGWLDGVPWVQAFFTVAASVYLTRGLHYDGLADVLDGAAAHTDPERFWTIVKDSRCGAFGAQALALASVGQVVLFHAAWQAGAFGAVIWAFVAGRAAGVAMGFVVKGLARPGLGQTFMAGATPRAAGLSLSLSLLLGLALVPGPAPIIGYALGALFLWPLVRLSRAVNGSNGDFLGAAIVVGECAALLGFALTL